MKKYWIILSALLLTGFAFFFYQRFNNAVSILHDSPEIAADSEKHSTRWYRKDPFKSVGSSSRSGVGHDRVHDGGLHPAYQDSIQGEGCSLEPSGQGIHFTAASIYKCCNIEPPYFFRES